MAPKITNATSSKTITTTQGEMSTLLYSKSDDLDYTELTLSYMDLLSSKWFQNFLNTTQNGAAHSSSGIDLTVLLRNLVASLCFCIIQLTFFCFFRNIFRFLYQPRCCCVPISLRMEPLPKGLLSWIMPTIKSSLHFYLAMGLDAYFFVRFISILLLFFVFIGFFNMLVLIPINWTGNDNDYSAAGLDKLSLSNISVTNVYRLNAHFVMSLLTICLFHCVLVHELRSFIKIRQAYLLSKRQKLSPIHKSLLICNVPFYAKNKDVLFNILSAVPGGVKRIWYVHDFSNVAFTVKRAKEALRLLEESEMKYLSKLTKINSRTSSAYKPDVKGNLQHASFYPPIYLAPFKIPHINRNIFLRLPGFLRIFALQKREPIVPWCLSTLTRCHEIIEDNKVLLSEEKLPKLDKLFVQFNSQTSAYIAHQCLLSQVQGSLSSTLVEVHPHDIIWENLARPNSIVATFEKYLVVVISIFIIILYVIPVSFIGLFSQLPLLTQLIPSMKWLYKLPEEVRDSISSFLPSILLAVLTDVLLMTFRYLTYYKGKLTGAELELDLQKWYFAFLFVQQFLVVTISTSIVVVFKQIVEQPASIPILLAANLPKAATFFFQYISLKAFAFCGNKFLRIDQLILHYTWYKICDTTPRQKFFRLIKLPKVKWGSVYPVYSVYGSIGLAYCIISPLVMLFVVFILCLVLLYYKYSLKYIYNHINESETYGRLYPVALFNLYTGIYCLECCLIGIFFSSRNSDDECPMKIQGLLMSIILLLTIFGNITIYNRYEKHFSYLPILSDKKFADETIYDDFRDSIDRNRPFAFASPADQENAQETTHYSNHALLYVHPAFKYEKPKMWLPSDPFGESQKEIDKLAQCTSALQGGSTKGAALKVSSKSYLVHLEVTEAAPDYK